MNQPVNLINEGFYRSEPDKKNPLSTTTQHSPVLIIGPARSATSMIAGALHHLGYYSGDGAVEPVFEDVRLREAIKKYDWNEVNSIANSYNSQHEQWLFKWTVPARPTSVPGRIKQLLLRQPTEVAKLRKLYHSLGNPKIIVTYKDVFSISNRNRISISSDILDGIRGALAAYEAIRVFLKTENPDVLMISSEKALKNKASLVQHLTDFCGVSATEKKQQAALDFIEPVPWRYLVSTKSDRCLGYVEPFNGHAVQGWAKFKDSDEAANVTLLIDDTEIATTTATGFRADLKEAGHRDGNCAFTFGHADLGKLQPGATVRVRVEGDTQDLSNSPQIVSQATRLAAAS